MSSVPDYAFTGLETQASVGINTSATYETCRREGGTLEAVRDFLATSCPVVPVRNLWTGKIIKYIRINDSDVSLGDFIFHKCLMDV